MANQEFNISWSALWRILALATLVAIAVVAIDVLVAVVLAIIISSALDPLVDWFEKKRIPRVLAAITIYILALFVIAVVIYILVPVGLVELNSFLHSTDAINIGSENILPGSDVDIRSAISGITADFLGGEVTLLGILSRFLGGVFLAMVILVLSFYMVINRHGVKKFLITITPQNYQEGVLEVYRRVHQRISSWFLAQLLLSAIVGLAVFIGLWILGVPYSLILGVAAAIFELVPYVGPIFSGGLAVLIGLSISLPLAIYTAALFFLIQQLEAHLLIPSVMSKSTNLSPVLVLIALLIGGSVFGVLGIILAVPLAVTFQEILYYWSGLQIPGVNTTVNPQDNE